MAKIFLEAFSEHCLLKENPDHNADEDTASFNTLLFVQGKMLKETNYRDVFQGTLCSLWCVCLLADYLF